MSGPSEEVAAVLSAEAADHARSVAAYANASPSRRALRRGRLLSSNGLRESVTFGFVSPNAALVSRGENRACATVRLVPYGVAEDADLLRRTDAEARLAVAPLAGSPGYVASRRVADDDKTAALVGRMTSPQGPAYHAVVSRAGVLICASLDDVVDPASPLSVDVAYESAVGAPEVEWLAGPPGTLVQLGLTDDQADSIAVLLAKLYAAYPTMAQPPTPVWTYGTLAEQANFLDDLMSRVGAVGPFDLASEVFEAPGTPAPRTGRSTAAAAVTLADTMGERSPLLGDYARLAASDRSRAMQATTRREFFVQRINSTHAQAEEAGTAAATAAAASPSVPRSVSNAGAQTYDFTTGRWQDENRSVY